jgi:hypothetical protein
MPPKRIPAMSGIGHREPPRVCVGSRPGRAVTRPVGARMRMWLVESRVKMSDLATCGRCDLPLVELNAYGERLRGCLSCNRWQVVASGEPFATGEWRVLPEDDIAALRGLGTS